MPWPAASRLWVSFQVSGAMLRNFSTLMASTGRIGFSKMVSRRKRLSALEHAV
jgi:hypothetical protein